MKAKRVIRPRKPLGCPSLAMGDFENAKLMMTRNSCTLVSFRLLPIFCNLTTKVASDAYRMIMAVRHPWRQRAREEEEEEEEEAVAL